MELPLAQIFAESEAFGRQAPILIIARRVIPECFYRESRRNSELSPCDTQADWTPDPFDVAQGRG
jgi:hypothetical protein